MAFVRATRKRAKLKLAITGPSGSGKTYSALRLATGLIGGKVPGKIGFIDTENESASLYSEDEEHLYNGKVVDLEDLDDNFDKSKLVTRRIVTEDTFPFDTLSISPPFTQDKFTAGINEAVKAGYEVIIIDSASHFWEGILQYKNKLDARGGNSYTNWNEAGDKFKDVLSAVLQSPVHIICCMRSKMDYVLETNDRGKQTPKKVGLAPIMRDGIEYEFTTVFDVDMNHQCKTSKDRTKLFHDHIFQITEETGSTMQAWMRSAKAAAVLDPPAPSQPTGPESNTSADLRADLTKRITRLATLASLVEFKPTLTAAKVSLTADDLKSVAEAYSAKKTELSNSIDTTTTTV